MSAPGDIVWIMCVEDESMYEISHVQRKKGRQRQRNTVQRFYGKRDGIFCVQGNGELEGKIPLVSCRSSMCQSISLGSVLYIYTPVVYRMS